MFRTTLLTVFLLVQVVFGGLPATYRRNGRIMGGMDANPGQYPSQISLRNSMNQHYCGGSIVNDHWVLSSSQCTTAVGAQPANLLVVVGSHLLSTGGISHECSEVINHPKYNPMNFANDIAVIKTTTPMNIGSNTIQPIPIINRAITNEVWGQLVGWGTKGQNEGSYPENLQWVYSNIIPHSECSKKIQINEDTICGFANTGAGACFGDAGGALLLPEDGVVGITSFLIGQCGFGYPDGFTDVYKHRDWVMKQIS